MRNAYPTSPNGVLQDASDVNAFLSRVLGIVCIALAVMGGTAYVLASSPTLVESLFGLATVDGKLVPAEGGHAAVTVIGSFVAMIGITFALAGAVASRAPITSFGLLMALAALMGAISAPMVLMYTGALLFNIFLITGAVFASAAVYGLTTKRDMTGWGSVLFLCLLGLIFAMIIGLFMQSTMFDFGISCVAVVLFTVLTAYDIQTSKERFYSEGGNWSVAVCCAANLYLDFANLFIHLLRIFGGGGKN